MAVSGFDRTRVPLLLASSSHAAVWAGLYVVGAVVCLAQVAGFDTLIAPGARLAAAAFAFSTAAAVYLLDRVKLRGAWLDPADEQAHPRRYAFVAGHARVLRVLIVALLAAAAWLGWHLLAWGGVIPLVAVAGVLAYAGRPRAVRPRPKDIILLKNVYVALGITGFGAIVAIAAIRPGADAATMWGFAVAHAVPLALSGGHLALRVLADAVLCDLDDEDADRRFGTGTLPIHLGRARAWNTALAVRLCTAAALAAIPMLPLWPRLAWAGVTVVSSVALRAAAPARVRDWVDARLAMEAAVVAAVLAVARG